jgi:hypothetical protein
MDAKKLLLGVVTTAIGFAFGFYLTKMIVKGAAKTTPTPSPSPAASTDSAEFYGDGFEY